MRGAGKGRGCGGRRRWLTVGMGGARDWHRERLRHREAFADAVTDRSEADVDDLAIEATFKRICRSILLR